MRITTGIDIVKISRLFRKGIDPNDAFMKRAYTAAEREQGLALGSEHAQRSYFASRFAGKEAVFKAISGVMETAGDAYCGFVPGDIQIIDGHFGRPEATLSGKTLKALEDKLPALDVSLSNEDEYAIANCVAVW
jgi:phosphopantetheine--protein transferase-like protein